MSNNSDPAAVLMGFIFVMALMYVAVVSAIILLAVAAILIIGWYLTHLIFRWLNGLTHGQLLSEHGGILLMGSAGLWALLAWLLVPQQWHDFLMRSWPYLAHYPYFIPILGGVLGLAWSMVVLYVAEQESDVSPFDISGMYSISEKELYSDEAGAVDLLTDSVVLGTDL